MRTVDAGVGGGYTRGCVIEIPIPRRWLATVPWYQAFGRAGLVAIDESTSEPEWVIHALAAAAYARHSWSFNELFSVVGTIGFATAGDRLLVSQLDGGLMGFSTEPQEATWSFDGDEALDGEGRGEGRSDDRSFGRPRDLTDAKFR